MKKIMFNDKYGLTNAVLEGRKTMTRRIIPLTDADMDYLDNAFDWDLRESVIIERYAQYEVGEIVAVAQAYKHIVDNHYFQEQCLANETDAVLTRFDAGWDNKMFVKSYYMPHHIRITDVKIERLRSISDEDCLKEGLMMDSIMGWYYFPNLHLHRKKKNTAGPTLFEYPEAAYYTLCKKLRMVLDNAANPWVFAYTFELVKGGAA